MWGVANASFPAASPCRPCPFFAEFIPEVSMSVSKLLSRLSLIGWNLTLVCLLVLADGATARAASPALGSITPQGARRGAEVEVVIAGARLKDAQGALFYSPGI